MSALKEKGWNTGAELLLYFAVAFCFGAWVSLIWPISFTLWIFASYCLVFASFYGLLVLLERERLWGRLAVLFPPLLYLIFGDLLILCHAGLAFLTFFVVHLCCGTRVQRYTLPALGLGCLLLWLTETNMPVYAAPCLIFLLFYGAAGVFCREPARWVVLLLAFSAATFLVPKRETPMRWEAVRRVIAWVGDSVDRARKELAYFFEGFRSGEQTPYPVISESGGLSGSARESSREALFLELKKESSTLYLRGSVCADISPEGLNSSTEEHKKINAWLAQYLNALYHAGVSREEAGCFSEVQAGKVTYGYMRTRELLLPETTFQVNRELYHGLQEQKGKGFSYDFSYLALDPASPYFLRMAMSETLTRPWEDYETISAYAAELYDLHLSDYLSRQDYEDCLGDASSAYVEQYLNTDMATTEIRALTKEVVRDCTSDFERAKAIEFFLRQYPYDTGTDLSESENYIEDFLFHTQRGYCVHYASAMVLMLRLCGIPARYVRGFLRTPREDGAVLASDAHAWAEGYMEGLGWVRFEPTAARPAAEQTTWGRALARKKEDAFFEYFEEARTLPALPELPAEEPKAPAAEQRTAREILLLIGGALAGILAFAVVLLLLLLGFKQWRYARLPAEEKVKEDVRVFYKAMEKRAPAEKPEATVFSLLGHVGNAALKEELEALFWMYYRVRFRGDTPTREEAAALHAAVRRVLKEEGSK